MGGCAQLRWLATGMRSVSSALLLAKRQQHLRACRCCSLAQGCSPLLLPIADRRSAAWSSPLLLHAAPLLLLRPAP